MLEKSVPPGYQREKKPRCPKLDGHKEWVDEMLEADKKVHHKQRHTAKRLYERMKEERGYQGSYTPVRRYVAKKRLKSREMFVPLSHDPGMAQCDFGQAEAIIAGQKITIHFFVMQLAFSDGIFVKAYKAENTESFCDGHVKAFEFFGGVPWRILYDNTTIAVSKILPDGTRQITNGFMALKSHYLFKEAFAAVGRGNEKGALRIL
jgi:transposase